MHSITLSTIFKSTDPSYLIQIKGAKRSVREFEGDRYLSISLTRLNAPFFG